MLFAEITNREVEHVIITSETSESDLIQRREILNVSVVYENQAPVRAALNGRLLLLEGIERAERNLLPIINSLLESREMSLADGRLMVPQSKLAIQTILDNDMNNTNNSRQLVGVNPLFRVIALGSPVPPFVGYPIDPPLRSRFQVRVVEKIPSAKTLLPITTNSNFSSRIENNDNYSSSVSNLSPTTLRDQMKMKYRNIASFIDELINANNSIDSTDQSSSNDNYRFTQYLSPDLKANISIAINAIPQQSSARLLHRYFPHSLIASTHNALVSKFLNEVATKYNLDMKPELLDQNLSSSDCLVMKEVNEFGKLRIRHVDSNSEIFNYTSSFYKINE